MNRKQLVKILRKNGYKATPQRLAIFELILSSKEHPTAEEIHNEVSKKFPSMSLSTVYQVLHLLQDLGQIMELKFRGQSSRFETNTTPHLNLICPGCGKIEDYNSNTIVKFWSKLENEFDFEALSQRIDGYRYCDVCKK